VAAVNLRIPLGYPRMSSWACGSVAIQHGVEPVLQIAARDRPGWACSRSAGANAMGIKNILCLSGDSMKMSPGRAGGWISGYRFDPDAVDPAADAGRRPLLDGREMKFPPKFFWGGGFPYASEPASRPPRHRK